METKIFHIVLYVLFGAFIVIGFGSVGIYGYLKKDENLPERQGADVTVEIWGTVPSSEVEPVMRQLNRRQEKMYAKLTYTQKNPLTVRNEYIESIAVGSQPDLLLLDHATVFAVRETIQTIPFSYFPLAQYQGFFAQPAEVFVQPDGYLALPFLMDTMVLYYNENLRLREHITVIPTVWSSFTLGGYQRIIGEYRESGKALIPLGGYGNYGNAVDLFTALMLQTKESPSGLTHDTVRDALTFYRSFADPLLSVYTWNTSLPGRADDVRRERPAVLSGIHQRIPDAPPAESECGRAGRTASADVPRRCRGHARPSVRVRDSEVERCFIGLVTGGV